MGFRERLARQSTATVAVVVIVALAVLWFSFSRSDPKVAPPTGQAYTTDDGQSYFVESEERISPFDKGGKQAIACHLSRVGNGPLFVGWMEKFDDDSAKILQRTLVAKRGPEAFMTSEEEAIVNKGRFYKVVGDTKWLPYTSLLVGNINVEVVKRPPGAVPASLQNS